MFKVKTKSGFVIDVDENRAKDWRFTKALAKWENDNTVLVGMGEALPFLLGDDGEKALMEHIKEKDGSYPCEKMIEEFRQILEALGKDLKEIKKSESSQV